MSARRTAHRESGASLILVLVALTVFGLLVPVLGQFGSTNGISGYIVKGLRFDRYAADNGVQGAIALAQTDRTMGRAHVPCPDVTSSMNVGSTAFRRDVIVKCQGFAGSGDPLGDPSTPKYAVLGLDPNGSHSIDIDSSGRLKTYGPWWANGNAGQTSADIRSVTIDARTDLFGAQGGCREAAGAHIFAAPKRCNAAGTPEPQDVTGSTPDLTGVPADTTAETADACASIARGAGVVELNAGIHWNLDWLNALTDGSCGRPVVIHLRPGVHYFDFDFYDQSRRGAGGSQWKVGGAGSSPLTIVGGTLSGGTDVTSAYGRAGHSNGATAPGTCDLASEGVELVLGSQSNITLASPAHMELCPRVTGAGAQHVAISGSGAGAPQTLHIVGPAGPTTAVGATVDGRDQFAWPNSPTGPIGPIRTPECRPGRDCGPAGTNYLEGVLSNQGRGEATVTMDVPNPFTKNDRLDALSIDISHREAENGDGQVEGNGNNRRNRFKEMWFEVTGLGAPRECRSQNLDKRDDWTQDTVTCDIRDASFPLPDRATVSTLKVILHIATNGGEHGSVAVDVDQVALRGAETALTARAQACGCEALFIDNSSSGNAAAAFVWGTVVFPTADVTEDFGGSTTFGLKRGVIAKRFKLRNLANDPNFIPVSLPFGGTYSPRTVEFEAQISGKPKLRARVVFPDPVGDPSKPLDITEWDTHP